MSKSGSTKCVHDAELPARASDYCRIGEKAAHYLHGLADAFEVIGDAGKSESLVHHLRHHAKELDMGTLWVEHAYKDNDLK